MNDSPDRNQTTAFYQDCRFSSCHQHQRCIYDPCRAPQAGALDNPTTDQEKLVMASHKAGLAEAYREACRICDRDDAAGVDEQGIIDNILAALAKLVERPMSTTDYRSDAEWMASYMMGRLPDENTMTPEEIADYEQQLRIRVERIAAGIGKP